MHFVSNTVFVAGDKPMYLTIKIQAVDSGAFCFLLHIDLWQLSRCLAYEISHATTTTYIRRYSKKTRKENRIDK